MKSAVCLLLLACSALAQQNSPAPSPSGNAAAESLRKRLATIDLTKPTVLQSRYIVLNASGQPGPIASRECAAPMPNAVNPESPSANRMPVLRAPEARPGDITPGLPTCENR